MPRAGCEIEIVATNRATPEALETFQPLRPEVISVEESARPRSTQTGECPVPMISLLLVDDNPVFLDLLRRYLEVYGNGELAIAGTALGGTEALTRAPSLRPDIIVIDLVMPDLPGLDAIPDLRRLLPETGIIALTFSDTTPDRQAALAAGADDFVSKARLEQDLLPAIWRLVGRARPRGPCLCWPTTREG